MGYIGRQTGLIWTGAMDVYELHDVDIIRLGTINIKRDSRISYYTQNKWSWNLGDLSRGTEGFIAGFMKSPAPNDQRSAWSS